MQHAESAQAGVMHDFSRIRGARVLLAEDVRLNREVAQAFLRQAGVQVDIATNGLEAISKVGENDYDLVLMDIQMPEMDGLTATQEIRKDPRHARLPIVAMTAHAMTGDRERSLAAGMNDHLTKPIMPERLFDALLQWIEPRETHEGSLPAMLTPPPLPAASLPLPVLEGIDTEQGLRHVGDTDLYHTILMGFPLEFGDTMTSIMAAVAVHDFHTARRLSHSLKSAAATIGARELSASAKTLEGHYAEGRHDHGAFEACSAVFQRTLMMLAALTASNGIA